MILQTYNHISNIKASVGSKAGTENCKEVSEEYKTTATSLEKEMKLLMWQPRQMKRKNVINVT